MILALSLILDSLIMICLDVVLFGLFLNFQNPVPFSYDWSKVLEFFAIVSFYHPL